MIRERFVAICLRGRLGTAAVLISAVAGLPGSLWGQWMSGSNGGIYYNGGNVGIGFTIPNYRLALHDGLYIGRPAGMGNGVALRVDGNGLFRIDYMGDDGATMISPNLAMTYTGNVGIGTTNPQHLLQVAGTIGAQEVLVTSTGADYVFQPGYRLWPLKEVAKYIETNHHLPDIPSADEVKREGLGVGEMEAKLLAKIEELTLQLIKEHERNDRLENELKYLLSEHEPRKEGIARLEAKQ